MEPESALRKVTKVTTPGWNQCGNSRSETSTSASGSKRSNGSSGIIRWTTLRVVSKKRTKSWFRAQNAAIARNQAREGFMHIHDDRTQASIRCFFGSQIGLTRANLCYCRDDSGIRRGASYNESARCYNGSQVMQCPLTNISLMRAMLRDFF